MANIFLDQSSAVVGQSIIPAALTTTTNGSTVDLIDGIGNMASAILSVGAVSGTQGTCDVKIQESTATNTGFTDITGATFTQFTTSNQVQIISFKPVKRYVRAYATFAGTFTSMLTGVNIFADRRFNPTGYPGWVNETGGS